MASSTDSLETYKLLLSEDVRIEEIKLVDFDDKEALDESLERQALERTLLWKLDKRMLILVLLYIFNYIDGTNTGTARLRGFEEDLQLQGQQFATVIAVLRIGYIAMQIPSNMLLNHIGRPSLYLGTCMALWGLASLMTGFATNYISVLIIRFFLGAFEASFIPGALFLLSKWYKRTELGLRTAVFFCGSVLGNAFGALVASAILDSMEGVLGFAAWRWLFFIEGAATVGIACLTMVVLPDFPETSRVGWLTEEELRLARRRMREEHDENESRGTVALMKSGFWMAMKDGNVWLLALVQGLQLLTTGFGVYFPTLTSTLGYRRTVSLLLCAPPYVCAAIFSFFVSWHSDKYGERFMHVVVPFAVGSLGFIVLLLTMNVKARYVSLFFMAQTNAAVGVLFAWCGNTFPSPPAKRAVALAFINAAGNLISVPSAYIWPESWGPSYRPSYAICALAGLGTIGLSYLFKRRLVVMNCKLTQQEIKTGASERDSRYIL